MHKDDYKYLQSEYFTLKQIFNLIKDITYP